MLTKKIAKENVTYMQVLDVVLNELLANKFFSKEEVLKAAGAEAFADSIRWDYIRYFVEADYGIELIPIVSRFFKNSVKDPDNKHKRIKTTQERKICPERYIAQGNGKKTAGYCLLDFEDGIIGEHRLYQKQGNLDGVHDACVNYKEKLEQALSRKIEHNTTVALDHDEAA